MSEDEEITFKFYRIRKKRPEFCTKLVEELISISVGDVISYSNLDTTKFYFKDIELTRFFIEKVKLIKEGFPLRLVINPGFEELDDALRNKIINGLPYIELIDDFSFKTSWTPPKKDTITIDITEDEDGDDDEFDDPNIPEEFNLFDEGSHYY